MLSVRFFPDAVYNKQSQSVWSESILYGHMNWLMYCVIVSWNFYSIFVFFRSFLPYSSLLFLYSSLIYQSWSQCSTVVRNTAVRATIKVNGKHPTLGTCRTQTIWPIDLKFDVDHYVGSITPHAKNCENRPRRAVPAYGWNIMFKCFFTFFIFFCWFLAQLWRTHFWEYRHRFCVKRRCSVRIDFLGGHNFNIKIFPHINPQKPQIFGQNAL